MRQHALGIFITFAAMGCVFVKTESVIEAFGFLLGFCHKPLAKRLEGLELATLDFEVRYDCATCVLGCHGILLSWDYTFSSYTTIIDLKSQIPIFKFDIWLLVLGISMILSNKIIILNSMGYIIP
jgi:hypothetical protein